MKKMIAVLVSMFVACAYAAMPAYDYDSQESKACVEKATKWCRESNHHCKIPPKDFCEKRNNILPSK